MDWEVVRGSGVARNLCKVVLPSLTFPFPFPPPIPFPLPFPLHLLKSKPP